MAKKKKTNGLNEFDVTYTEGRRPTLLTKKISAIDKFDAILKFKQENPGVNVKDAKPVPKPVAIPVLHADTITDNKTVYPQESLKETVETGQSIGYVYFDELD